MKSVMFIAFFFTVCLKAQIYHSWELTKSTDDVEISTILSDQYFANEGNFIDCPVLISMNKNTQKVDWGKKYQYPGFISMLGYPFFRLAPNNKIILGFMPEDFLSPESTTTIVTSLNLQGVPEWSKKLLFSHEYILFGVSFDSQGNLLLLGWGQETFDGDGKIWVTCMDTLGNVNWVKSYSAGQFPSQIAYKIDGFSSGIYTSLVYGLPSGKDVTVISRLDENGHVIWSKIFKDSQGKFYDQFRCIGEDSNGDIIVVGYPDLHGTPYGDFGMVVKINQAGEVLYSKMVREDSLLHLYMNFIGTIDQTNVVLGGRVNKDDGNNVAFAIKLDENGHKINEQIYPHPLNKLGPFPSFQYLYQNDLYGMAKTSPNGYTLTGIAYKTPADKTEAFLIETDNDLVAPCNSEPPANPFIVEDYPLTTEDVTLTVKDENHNWVDAVILVKPYVLNDTIVCQETVGTEEMESAVEANSFTLLPNPATDLVQINFTTPTTSPARLYLFDLTGKRLQAVTIPAGETWLSISVNELPPGSYFIQLLTDGKPPETQKLTLIR